MTKEDTSLAVIANNIKHIKGDVKEIKDKMEKDYVTKTEFDLKMKPIERVVYGLVGLILVAVVTAIVAGVLK